jgi:hypothetical protein
VVSVTEGKRSCIEESTARNSIFLTFTALMQNYSMTVPDGDARPCTTSDGGPVLSAKPFSAKMKTPVVTESVINVSIS